MTEPEDYLSMATEAEEQATLLPDGFERAERLRRASAWRQIAELLQAQKDRLAGLDDARPIAPKDRAKDDTDDK